jgi:MoxR-like ATPase
LTETSTPSAEVAAVRTDAEEIDRQVVLSIVGQRDAIRGVLISLILGGHALLEGVPGLGKTSMVRAFAGALGISHSRIQFTPDLMPADITGTVTLVDSPNGPQLVFERGPLFAGLILADEINRASPRTQSALLEAMQEGTVTIGNETHRLPTPFSVLATQNPVEMQGTYPLPEAQLDRFLLKLQFDFPTVDELTAIVRRTALDAADALAPVSDGAQLLRMGALARSLPVSSSVLEYTSRIVIALQPSEQAAEPVRQYVRLGPSPRGAQALMLAGSVSALLAGRHHLAYEDVRAISLPALRHRLILTFDAERNGVTADDVVRSVVRDVPEDAT